MRSSGAQNSSPTLRSFPRSGAIVLPGTTEEVQALVKACNKYKVRYKAISNGWGFYSALGLDDDAIHVDMRRFNRIIELNEKSMYAVVEPYVTCAMLQAEAMKIGLNVHMIGAGCNTCAMPITAHQGTGSGGVSTSCGDRNTLAVEWVTPDGELLKFGSAGAGAGWFCGDGPGPSLRGLIHGPQGVMGGLGIFTKMRGEAVSLLRPARTGAGGCLARPTDSKRCRRTSRSTIPSSPIGTS